MSGTDPTILLNANHSSIAPLLSSSESLWMNNGYSSSQIFAIDNTARVPPLGFQASFGGTDRFRIRKRGGRVHNMWLRLSISAGTVNALNQGSWVDDLGANIIDNIRIEYASKTIHEYSGEALKFYQRLMYHDVTRETYNALALAGLPPGAGGFEAARATGTAIQLFVPMDWLWFTRTEGNALTPEALASELDVIVTYRRVNELVYGRVIIGGAVANPYTADPVITLCELCTQLVFTPHAEKVQHLATFESTQGQMYKILDFEEQPDVPVANLAAHAITVKLDNFRLDSQFIMFVVRDDRFRTAFNRDRTMSDPTPTILSGGGSVASLLPITSFQLKANGSTIVDLCTDLENRALWRKMYFPGSQIADFVYFIPFSWLLRESAHVTGFQNMSNLGSVELILNLPAAPAGAAGRVVDVYNICHNMVQKKKGDIIKILR